MKIIRKRLGQLRTSVSPLALARALDERRVPEPEGGPVQRFTRHRRRRKA